MKDSPLVGAGGRELHHYDVVAAGVALAVEVSALRVPTDNNGVGTVYLSQLGLGRRSAYYREFDPHALQHLELIVNGSHKQNTS